MARAAASFASDAAEAALAPPASKGSPGGAAAAADGATLQALANKILPDVAFNFSTASQQAIIRNKELEQHLQNLDHVNQQDITALRYLYEVIDRLRVSAKSAQNFLDRSMILSHPFVGIIEGVYPCPGADAAMQAAHRLHLSIGRTKDAIGNPPGGIGELDQKPSSPTGVTRNLGQSRGAADLLAEMERRIGRHSSSEPGGLHAVPMLDVQMQAIPPAAVALVSSTAALPPGIGSRGGDSACRPSPRCARQFWRGLGQSKHQEGQDARGERWLEAGVAARLAAAQFL